VSVRAENFRLLWSREDDDILEICYSEIRFYSYFRGAAGRLVFKCLPGDVYTIHPQFKPGQLIGLWLGGEVVWRGRIFSLDFDGETWEVTCFDQLRYLLNKDSKVFSWQRPDQIISSVIGSLGLTRGSICNVPYTVPTLVCQGQMYLDCIEKSLEQAEQALSRRYLFYDKAGSLCLKPLQETVLDVVLQSGKNILGYKVGTSIDKDVYTEVKLTQYPATSAKFRSRTVQNRAKMSEWGRLRYFAKVDRELNQAQVQSRAEAILADNAAALQTLEVTAPGEISCFAGFRPWLIIDELGVNGRCLIESAEHIISGDDGYIMRLKCTC